MVPFTASPLRNGGKSSSRAQGRARRLAFEALESRRLLTTVAGTVYEDLNRNGVQDSGELGLTGIGVVWNGSASGGSQTGFGTSSNGAYSLNDIGVTNGNVSIIVAPASLLPNREVTTPLTNGPASSFTSNFGANPKPRWISAGPLDAGNTMDLAVADTNQDKIFVYLNMSGGFGATPASYTVSDKPMQVVIEDLDQDGDQDLIVAFDSSGNLSYLVNNGAGVFGVPQPFSPGGLVTSIAVADVMGDARPEIVGLRPGTKEIVVWSNNSSPASIMLGAPVFSPASNDPNSIVAARLDATGHKDLLLLERTGHAVIRYDVNAQGQATATGQINIDLNDNLGDPMVLVAGDLNAVPDGRDDFAVARLNDLTVSLYFNMNGQFNAANRIDAMSAWEPVGLAIADVDGDRDNDVMVNTYRTPYGLILNQGGTFSDAGASPPNGSLAGTVNASPAVADFNADGVMDFAYANEPLEVRKFQVDFGRIVGGQYAIRSSLNENFTEFNFGIALKVSAYRTSQGDYNGDGTVNAADLAVWRANLGQDVIGPGKSADSDSDRDVDGMDFLRWQRRLGAAVPANSPAPQSDGPLAVILSMSLNDSTRPRQGAEMIGDGVDRSVEAKSPGQVAARTANPTRNRPCRPGDNQDIESDKLGLPLEPLRANFARALDEAFAQSLPGLYRANLR